MQLLDQFLKAQSELVTQTADLSLGTLADMVEANGIDLAPTFQRRERWNPEKQSALIESFLLNVPVPPVYLSEEKIGTYTAIDGKQRLRAISDFIKGRLRLTNLERLVEAEGITFADLPIEIKNSLLLRPFLRVVTLLRQTDSNLKYEVFIRLNKGGEILNFQEIRNVAFRGMLNDGIYAAAESDFLKLQLKIHSKTSSAYKNMEDAEYVLRFIMLNRRMDRFQGDLSKSMDEFMRDNQHADAKMVADMIESFYKAISNCQDFWGVLAFKRPEGKGWRSQFLAGMYDAQMLAAARLSPETIKGLSGREETIVDRTRVLFEDAKFEEAVRVGTNTPQRIKYRADKVHEMLMKVAHDSVS